jgi:hypothetical protein
MNRIAISQIVIDGGTQIRAAINDRVVADYAERMSEGVMFPPVVLFHDGNAYYMADGFHRALASTRVGFSDIDANVQPGTKADAVWFALGANKENGQRLTEADKKHAVLLALTMWPNKTQREIAEQVGCAQSFVSYVSTNINSDNRRLFTSRDRKRQERFAAVRVLLEAGQPTPVIAKELGISRTRISEIRVELGFSKTVVKTRDEINHRKTRMREMAALGHSSRQIAAALGLTDQGCRDTLRKESIDVPADRIVGKSKHHNSTRIIEHIVMDAETLTSDVNLITFSELDPDRIGEWADSLIASRKALAAFIRRLLKEKSIHVEVA